MAREIQLTRGKVTIVDDEMFDFLNQWKWHAVIISETCSYAARQLGYKKPTIYMHGLILGLEKGQRADHINGNGLDNRRENLRKATPAQNMANRKRQKNNRSGYKGVMWDKVNHRWAAYCKRQYIGHFVDPIEAAKAYDSKAKEIFGEYARTNF